MRANLGNSSSVKSTLTAAKAVANCVHRRLQGRTRVKMMLILGLACFSLPASFFSFSLVHLDAPTSSGFQEYVEQFENSAIADFTRSGRLGVEDDRNQNSFDADAGKPMVKPRLDRDLPNGSIEHLAGVIHINGVTVDEIGKLIGDYPNYTKYFKGDLVGAASGTREPDSTNGDEHFRSRFLLESHSPWISVALDSLNDAHNRCLDHGRWMSRSQSVSIKELRDVKNPTVGTLPEGDDHGFLWRANLYWLAREHSGGVDLELDSIMLSRRMPGLVASWCKKRNRQGVEKMLSDVKAAIALAS